MPAKSAQPGITGQASVCLRAAVGNVPRIQRVCALPGPNPVIGWGPVGPKDVGKIDKAIQRRPTREYIGKLSQSSACGWALRPSEDAWGTAAGHD